MDNVSLAEAIATPEKYESLYEQQPDGLIAVTMTYTDLHYIRRWAEEKSERRNGNNH